MIAVMPGEVVVKDHTGLILDDGGAAGMDVDIFRIKVEPQVALPELCGVKLLIASCRIRLFVHQGPSVTVIGELFGEGQEEIFLGVKYVITAGKSIF